MIFVVFNKNLDNMLAYSVEKDNLLKVFEESNISEIDLDSEKVKTNGLMYINNEFLIPENVIIDDRPKENHKTDVEVLQEENKLLKAQVNALATNQEFLENCLIEVGQIIYA